MLQRLAAATTTLFATVLAASAAVWQLAEPGDEGFRRDLAVAYLMQGSNQEFYVHAGPAPRGMTDHVVFVYRSGAGDLSSVELRFDGDGALDFTLRPRLKPFVDKPPQIGEYAIGRRLDNGDRYVTIRIDEAVLQKLTRVDEVRISENDRVVWSHRIGMESFRDVATGLVLRSEQIYDGSLDDVIVAACDHLAAHPRDVSKRAEGVAWSDLDGLRAARACGMAAEIAPDAGRLRYQMGRALDRIGHDHAPRWLEEAAYRLQYPAAFNHLGLLYRNGEYVEKDLRKAAQIFARGEELGDPASKHNLAVLLIEEGNPNDRAMGRDKLEQLAAKGDALAQRALGSYMLDGTFSGASVAAAQSWLEEAAEGGDGPAAYRLAGMHRDGTAINASAVQYLSYLRMAADAGHAKAREELAGQ